MANEFRKSHKGSRMDVSDGGPYTVHGIWVADLCSSGVRRIFEKGGQARSQKFEKIDKIKMRKMKTKKRFSLRFSPFFCPDLGEDQKEKGLHSDSVRFSAQIFYPNFKGRGHGSNLRTILRYLSFTGDPEGTMAQCHTS